MSLGDEIITRIARVGALHAAPVAPCLLVTSPDQPIWPASNRPPEFAAGTSPPRVFPSLPVPYA
ncbi:hypothetical protein [Photorhabdus tasmaniensis]|uniref:hypothetical protein n=1 Tax=Photorhabdus tasmaniensis TaxID=1004159 RepID=UPI00140CF0E6|nr:hypothetical protein [Photorhabdus tasmaniensis]